MKTHILFKFNKKNGKVTKTITAGTASGLKLWALQNTTETTACIIIDKETHGVIYLVTGQSDKLPKVTSIGLGTCDEYGIPIEAVDSISDERFE